MDGKRLSGINFFGQFYGNLGIPIHTRNFALALSKQVEDLRLIPIFGARPEGLDIELRQLIKTPSRKYKSFCFWYPNLYKDCLSSDHGNIGYFIFEYNKIPKDFVEEINKLDLICTASQWGLNTLKNNGVTIPIKIIPGGVNHNEFNSKNRNLNNNVFRFLHIGKAEERKNTSFLIGVFNEVFKGDEDIRLTLMISNPHIDGFNSLLYLKRLSYELNYPIDNIDVRENIYTLTTIYNTHHCAIFPSKAEGIGLPIVESMSSGLPVIVSNNSGITEYANDDNCILLKDLTEEEIYDPLFFPERGRFGTWMTPSKKELAEKMVWVYNNRDKIEDIGKRAEEYMSTNYTWEKSAIKFIESIHGNKI